MQAAVDSSEDTRVRVLERRDEFFRNASWVADVVEDVPTPSTPQAVEKKKKRGKLNLKRMKSTPVPDTIDAAQGGSILKFSREVSTVEPATSCARTQDEAPAGSGHVRASGLQVQPRGCHPHAEDEPSTPQAVEEGVKANDIKKLRAVSHRGKEPIFAIKVHPPCAHGVRCKNWRKKKTFNTYKLLFIWFY